MTKREAAGQLTARTAIEVGTVGIGLAVAGPVGALGAALLKPALELVTVRDRRGLRNVERLVEAVTESVGLSADEFEAWAKSKDGRLMLTTGAIQAAYSTMCEHKVKALAAVLTENLQDDAHLDLGVLVVAALADLEAAHVRVLDAMVNGPLPPRPEGTTDKPGVALQSQLGEQFPHLAAGVVPIMATLVRHGLADNRVARDDGNAAWAVTPFGCHCLEYLLSRKSGG
ncbi:hypothetical protein KBX08_32040 [Micromonospora sp. H61]|uniref:hypothetical protein n=1 Tax=Micromonospora sp. H61 TaxID=2824888 RepID=UPI001B36F689|nr:hypothetical protein [Micromonospora sp. H61]MBQ0994694.1 hypothetical protein [Micromonospora sp. H61]